MNTQEAKEFFNNLGGNLIVLSEGDKYIELGAILSMIDKIEPDKPVIPRFIANWLKQCKDDNCSLRDALNYSHSPSEVNEWFLSTPDMSTFPHQELFARAWSDGYEVEKEQMYTVVIPNPNIDKNHVSLLRRSEDDKLELWTFAQPDLSRSIFHFTEDEIKEDFEWACDAGFAKPLEVE